MTAIGQEVGSVRGVVQDKDFDAPLGGAQVQIVELNLKAATTDQGHYVFSQVPAGKYTLSFAKDGYARQVKGDVIITPGQMTEVSVSLPGEVVEMDEFIVQDMKLGGGSEEKLLAIRADSSALISGVSADQMSKAAVSNAAGALRLVAGASVQDDKYATVRGLPDRYVNSQMNGVRLPTADVDKRAVQLDQFPASVIERIEVTKTFTPDQQGDASGGAVNVVLKGIPDEDVLKFSINSGYNTQSSFRKDFLTSKGGGVNWPAWRKPRDPGQFSGGVGVIDGDTPMDYNWSMVAGGKQKLPGGWKAGGLASLFYKRDSYFCDDGINDALWVDKPGERLSPRYSQGAPEQGDFKTSLFDIKQASEQGQWGGLGAAGIENKNHWLRLTFLYTRSAKDTSTLAEDTRGKKYYFPDYKVNDPLHPGNQARDAAPYIRTETLEYTERTTQMFQLSGKHTLPMEEVGVDKVFKFLQPTIDWTAAVSGATMDQPDKRQFGSMWWAPSFSAGAPPYVPPSVLPAVWRQYKPAANFTVGNLQRVWKDISEDSDQFFVNLKYPFQQWSGDKGYVKVGMFNDAVDRRYNQSSYSNFGDNGSQFDGGFDDFWSRSFLQEGHPMTASDIDVNYIGKQKISALYYMADVPLCSYFDIIGGVRYEKTQLSIINSAESGVVWYPPSTGEATKLNPGDADVAFEQKDALPSLGFVLKPVKQIKIHAVYAETVARQTFKELTPIQQMDFLGGPVFIGNPQLQMSAVKNYDVRMDYTPTDDQLYSIGFFRKDVTNPIEYVQRVSDFAYTTPINYPEGTLSGFEFEARQKMGRFSKALKGLTVGGNATLIKSEVTLPPEEAAGFEAPNIRSPMPTRDMTGAPKYLYNLFFTYDIDRTGTQLGLFYSVKGDTLIAGAGQSNGHLIPNIYEKEYGMLNFTLTQKLSKIWKLNFQAKNLLNPRIDTVYRTDTEDATRSSYQKGMEFWIGLSAEF
ncbi:MAG: carboxypeptidase regulatory-like domain-containing protein [Planctomycetota bacterium]